MPTISGTDLASTHILGKNDFIKTWVEKTFENKFERNCKQPMQEDLIARVYKALVEVGLMTTWSPCSTFFKQIHYGRHVHEKWQGVTHLQNHMNMKTNNKDNYMT